MHLIGCSAVSAAGMAEMAGRIAPYMVLLIVWAVLPFILPRNITDLLVFAGIYAIAGFGSFRITFLRPRNLFWNCSIYR